MEASCRFDTFEGFQTVNFFSVVGVLFQPIHVKISKGLEYALASIGALIFGDPVENEPGFDGGKVFRGWHSFPGGDADLFKLVFFSVKEK